MTIESLRTRLKEAKKVAYAADIEANHAAINAHLIEDAVERADYRLTEAAEAVYANAYKRRLTAVKTATKAAKDVEDAQWRVDMVAAREMVMFDGRDTI